MKKIEINPTTENIIDMLNKDAIGRNQYISTFIELLDNIDENFTIFLNGDWGTGKTFFVKQVYTLLTYYNTYIKEKLDDEYVQNFELILQKDYFKELKLSKNFVPIYYNAWNNDSHIDPINSIIFNIIKEHDILKDYQKESSDLLDKIASIVDVFSNGSIKELVSTFKGKDLIPEITTMEDLKGTLNILLDKLLQERGDKLIIFVDELDRCNPVYAIKLLERIKHFFDHENIIFVFSVNINELTNTICNFYGQNFDSHRYLNKFFDISIDLPLIDVEKFMRFLGLENNGYWFNDIAIEVVNNYKFTMRDCVRYYQSLKIVQEFCNTSFQPHFREEKGKELIKIVFLPVLLGIKVIDLKSYMEIINGKNFTKFYQTINRTKYSKRSFEILYG